MIMILELNEYIEKFSEIKPHLDLIGEDLNIEYVTIQNDGCKAPLVQKIVKYLKGFDIVVTLVDSK